MRAGEIDIIEQVNNAVATRTTLHTSTGCSQSAVPASAFSGARALSQNSDHKQKGPMSGPPAADCDVKAAGQGENEGCPIDAAAASKSFGAPFNDADGGVFAFLWDSAGNATELEDGRGGAADGKMAAWYFDRSHIPADLAASAGTPEPKGWGRVSPPLLLLLLN